MDKKYHYLAGGLLLAGLAIFFLLKSRGPGPSSPVAGSVSSFEESMNSGKNYYDRGEADKAVASFRKAVALSPSQIDSRLNLANALLLQGSTDEAATEAREAMALDHKVAAAHYILGVASLRQAHYEEASKELQTAYLLDPLVAATAFQLGRAHFELGQLEDAIAMFQETIRLEPQHGAAHYSLSQALVRAGRAAEAAEELKVHQQISSKAGTAPPNPAIYERSKHTQARLPFRMEQPETPGPRVVFRDETVRAFGSGSNEFRGPIGVIDFNRDGRNSLFVVEEGGFRVLENSNGVFSAHGPKIPGVAGAKYRRMLVGNLHRRDDSDRYENVVVLGDATHVYKFATNAAVREVTALTGLQDLRATDGALVDLDFTGKLDLLAVSNETVQVFRNLGNFYFKNTTVTSGIPAVVTGARRLLIEDWNNDDLMDVLVERVNVAPLVLTKIRGGPLATTNGPADLPQGSVLAVGDLDNDLRADFAVVAGSNIEIKFGGARPVLRIPIGASSITGLKLVDYDNDGWLDLVAVGAGVRVWRNQGDAGFRETTSELGFDAIRGVTVETVTAADFRGQGAVDFLLTLADGSLRFWGNDGGAVNHQLKARLIGNRSNSSGLGAKVEIAAGGLRLTRTVSELPVEIGVGKHRQLDSVTVRWFDLAVNTADVPSGKDPINLVELQLPTGSCPYLYAWDGKGFRFVTDILGAAPLGLHLSDDRLIDADPDEFVRIGDEASFPARAGHYVLQITEELREVLYLERARLVAVDHPIGTVVASTSKLRPGKPFPPADLMTLGASRPLLRATRSAPGGAEEDVTEALRSADGVMVSPLHLRIPQLRGLAEPYSITLDFGTLPAGRPLVLALTGWLRFGGGMANVAGSHNPDLPFPFPQLEVEGADGGWQKVAVDFGAPAGKTKTILIDLSGRLPEGSRRLRVTTAFEIHWDRAELFEKSDAPARRTDLKLSSANLHWRGFSEFEPLDWAHPLTPRYESLRGSPPWRITPSGWCTRYGEVGELLSAGDEAMVLIDGGDELTLSFAAAGLPEKPAGWVRDFFLFASGWDKDSDFHVERGWTVEPLPWRGMDDQRYGREAGPAGRNDLMKRYTTRWVGPLTR